MPHPIDDAHDEFARLFGTPTEAELAGTDLASLRQARIDRDRQAVVRHIDKLPPLGGRRVMPDFQHPDWAEVEEFLGPQSAGPSVGERMLLTREYDQRIDELSHLPDADRAVAEQAQMIWAMFQRDHADAAVDRQLADQIALEVAQSGPVDLNTEAGIIAFNAQVASGVAHAQRAAAAELPRAVDDMDDGRTAGLSTGGGRTAPGAARKQDGPGDFLKDLQEAGMWT